MPTKLLEEFVLAKTPEEEKALIVKHRAELEDVKHRIEEERKAGSRKKDVEINDVRKKLMKMTNKSLKLRKALLETAMSKNMDIVIPTEQMKRYAKFPHNPAVKNELKSMEKPVSKKPKHTVASNVNHTDGIMNSKTPKPIQVII